MRSVVVFPAPSGPTRPKISPSATVRLRWSTAVSAPKRRVRSRVSMIGSIGCIAQSSTISASAGMFDFNSRRGFSISILMR